MGLMMRRRRPMARMAVGAAVGGAAYHAGKKNAEQGAINEQAQEAYASTQAAPQPQYTPPPPQAAAAAPPASSETGDLDHLVELHNSGALTDDEFTAAKAKLLGI